jgi:hypothetical protein
LKYRAQDLHASGIVKIDNHLKEFVRRTPQVQDVLLAFHAGNEQRSRRIERHFSAKEKKR